MPEGSLRREFTFKGDEVTLVTMLYGCSKAKSVVGVGDVPSIIIVCYRNDSFLLSFANPLFCKDIIMCVERLSNPMQGLFFFHFYPRESKDRDSLCNHFGFLKQIANFSHPLLVEVFERTGSA